MVGLDAIDGAGYGMLTLSTLPFRQHPHAEFEKQLFHFVVSSTAVWQRNCARLYLWNSLCYRRSPVFRRQTPYQINEPQWHHSNYVIDKSFSSLVLCISIFG